MLHSYQIFSSCSNWFHCYFNPTSSLCNSCFFFVYVHWTYGNRCLKPTVCVSLGRATQPWKMSFCHFQYDSVMWYDIKFYEWTKLNRNRFGHQADFEIGETVFEERYMSVHVHIIVHVHMYKSVSMLSCVTNALHLFNYSFLINHRETCNRDRPGN